MMFGGKKEVGGMAHAIHRKYFEAHAPERDEDSAGDYSHKDAMHDAMHELHEAVHSKDVGRMAKAFAAGHILARHYHDESDEQKQDSVNEHLGIKAGFKGYS